MGVMGREAVIEVLARMMRDEAYPEFAKAPPPAWARRAAALLIDYHQPLLRDHLLAEAFHDVRVEAAGVAAYKVDLAEKVRALPEGETGGGWSLVRRAAVLDLIEGPPNVRLIEDPAPSEGGEPPEWSFDFDADREARMERGS